MPSPNKPWFLERKKQTWYANISGKGIRFGKDREEAFRKFHTLKAEKPKLHEEALLVVMDELLTSTQKNRREGTYRFYRDHAQHFTDFLKEQKRVDIQADELDRGDV